MSKKGLTYAQAGVDIDAGNRLVELIKPLVRATRAAGRRCRARRLRRPVRPQARGLQGPGPGRRHRRRRHQAQDRHRDRPARHHRHRSRRHVRQRPRGAGRRAAVLPRLFRLRQARPGDRRRGRRGHRRRLPAGGLRADRRRDRRDAGPVSAAATTTSPASRSARPSAARCCRAAISRPATSCSASPPPGVHSNGYSLVRRLVAEAGLALGCAPAPFDRQTTLGEALLDADAHLREVLPRGDPRDQARQGAGAHHRRRIFRQHSARAAEGLRRAHRSRARPGAAGVPLAGADRRHRRDRDAAHLQLRHRHDRRWSRPRKADAVAAVLRREGETRRAPRRARCARRRQAARDATTGRLDSAHGDSDDPQARRDPDLRPRLQHGGADRGREGRRLSGRDRARRFQSCPTRPGLQRARAAGIATAVVDHNRSARTAKRSSARCRTSSKTHRIELVCLAGFMRLLTPWFVRRWHGRMINIHPSLLPAFKGLDTHARALAAGAKQHGATVHFVVPEIDSGPIIAQASGAGARRRHRSDARRARARGRAPHLSAGAALVAEGRVRIVDGRCVIDGGRWERPAPR